MNVERMKRDEYNPDDEFCNGDDISDLYWDMSEGLMGNNDKSDNIFYIDRIFIAKQHRRGKIATASMLMLPKVLYEQFNADVGYLVAKTNALLDNQKQHKIEVEVSGVFWESLGFDIAKKYRYYNMTNDFVKENVERLEKTIK